MYIVYTDGSLCPVVCTVDVVVCVLCFVQLMVDGSFAVSRRTWIDTEGSRWTKRPWSVGLQADNISLLIGIHPYMSVCLFSWSVCPFVSQL